MNVQTEIEIKGTKEAVWEAVSDIEKSKEFISGIEGIDVLHQPEEGFIGFKWKETRTMFGKTATEVMTIVEAEPLKYYKTHAESHGAIYESIISIDHQDGKLVLKMGFQGTPVTLMGKLMGLFFDRLMKKSTIKALDQDLQDIKRYIES